MSRWEIVYKKAIDDNGNLFFPEKLTHEFLEQAKRTMGSYLFANQYLNEIIPDGAQTFKKEWLKYYKTLPSKKFTFAFIDPAISQQDGADFTGVVVIDVDEDQNWYVRLAKRQRITPTEIVNLAFGLFEEFKPMCIGIETVAYQEALLYMLNDEMRRRNKIIPVTGIKPGTDRTKEARILGLVPRFEWGRILLTQGLHDFEMEFAQFPRGTNDDLLDAMASLEQIITYPTKERPKDAKPNPTKATEYERWYIRNIEKLKSGDIDQSNDPTETY